MEHEPEARIIGRIERGLTSDDPELAARMDTLNARFSEEGRGGGPVPPRARRSRRARTVLVLVVIALVGLFLTMILNASSGETPAPPSSLVPAASL
ncbi:DUF3040 domain-containing protein [Streptomyces lavendofoliae]|uniref:DUF3040 domain-containing protein n=1 Tax=Streptomyces lavendofoliae TaxID=67314 RepID=A0A918HZS5_9ACTN|nr:DUF3040 domain-containing protein [Streptomyces lavendofoliae]GGU49017.1 hypothetical protein GCM10010274_41880 [Streptomyces lavendofoliae]